MHYKDCPNCLGTKVVFDGSDYVKCPTCNGQGILENLDEEEEDNFYEES